VCFVVALAAACSGGRPPLEIPDFDARFRASCAGPGTLADCRALSNDADAAHARCVANDGADQCAEITEQAQYAHDRAQRIADEADLYASKRHTRSSMYAGDHGTHDAEARLRAFTDARAAWLSAASARCESDLSTSLCDKPPANVTEGGPTPDDVDDCKRACQPIIDAALDGYVDGALTACKESLEKTKTKSRAECDIELPAAADVPSDVLIQRKRECTRRCKTDKKTTELDE
jgi:hypothetical protein